MNILQITVIFVVSTRFGDYQYYWGGGGGGEGTVVASMHPASTIVAKPINCEYTSILGNMLLFRTLRYYFCRCSVIYVYKTYFKYM